MNERPVGGQGFSVLELKMLLVVPPPPTYEQGTPLQALPKESKKESITNRKKI